jgi:hypothetical protein
MPDLKRPGVEIKALGAFNEHGLSGAIRPLAPETAIPLGGAELAATALRAARRNRL